MNLSSHAVRFTHRIFQQFRRWPMAALLPIVALAGCTNTYRFTVEEARRAPRPTYDVAVVPANISGVVLRVPLERVADSTAAFKTSDSSSRTVDSSIRMVPKLFRFNAQAGTLRQRDRLLTGITEKGDTLCVPFDSVVTLQFRGTDGGFAQIAINRAIESHDSLIANPSSKRKFRRERFGNWQELRFDKSGGYFDTTTSVLTGKSSRGKPVAVPLYEVYYLQYSEPNPYKTVRVLCVLGILSVLVLGPIHRAF